ncbi:MAG: family metallopeptidase [Xanthomonadaceae bacterium]|nr:family metallopeptidase [Xanthomonadaceae bacterium]
MNFFEQQAAARRASTRLIVLFAMAVVGIVVAVDFAAWVAYGGSADKQPGEVCALLTFTTLATLAIIGLGSLYRMASLRGGGEPIALQFGGVPVAENTTDLDLRRLRNVVEEIAIASGVPVPGIYVLEHESAINAFAAGYSPSDAVVAVTRGAIDRLNRDELQGVIAHEFSHILNGDMRLNIRLIGILFGILMLALIGRKVLQFSGRGRDSKGAGAILVAALVAMVVGYIGLFFARMIKAGVSRTRESLADASAVQFTRQTEGLAGALKKIAGLEEGSKLNDRADAEEASHMLFGDGVGFSGLFATHPPLLKRIQALEPQFRADQLDELQRRWLAAPPVGMEEDARMGLDASSAARLPNTATSHVIAPLVVAAQVAQPTPDDYQRADAIVATIPDKVRALAADRDTVVPLVLGLLLDRDPALAARQCEEIAARLGKPVADSASQLQSTHLEALHPMLRLPLASLAFPVLRLRPRPELNVFMDTAHAMIHADGQVSLFEYCLGRLLQSQIRESLDPAKYARYGRRKLSDVRSEVATLLCVVAQAGNDTTDDARRAYLAGIQRILPSDALPYLPREEGILSLDAIWELLDALDPLAKQALIEAITATISHDNRITVAESELLRTICGVLHCPLPPMLQGA